MLAGLGMAETTPGPLIMVVQYVGFLAGYRTPGHPAASADGNAGRIACHLGDLHALLPLGFIGAPYVEALNLWLRALGAALSAVTAAVVGVTRPPREVWFGVHVIFRETEAWQVSGLS